MSLRRTLEEIEFGPFNANDVLDEYVTHKKNVPVDLYRLQVVRNGRKSGLDESEASISKKPVGKVRYFGILYVEDLGWISPNGRRLIHDDMRRRGLKLTLESIYGPDRPNDGLTVKIAITVKHIGLTYLTDKNYSNDMMLFSLTTGMSTRRLRIVSLSPICSAKSQEYIAAYRFYRLLSDLCSGISKPTPEDFFNALMNHNREAGIRVSKDAIVKRMLKHAIWLTEQAKRHVNIQSWKDFARTKVLDVDRESDVEMAEPDDERLVRPILSSSAPLALSPKQKRSWSVDSRSSLEYASDDQLFGPEPERGSSPERSPSPPLTDPYVAARVPIVFRLVPRIPDDFHWWCEIEGCYYNIDMLNLTGENLVMLDGETVAKLRLQDWSLSDPWVRLAFKAMVEDHRAKHLESWGLRCIKGPSGALAYIELVEPPGPDREKDKFSDLKIEFTDLL
ncbi:hypothetical protein BDM02DRAFT_3264890 [Thelephora ganbajun]|uniref:Uncharacterized protein n=1 Tax=Thelephora ganbajun TaxID=370292 RepID=A0ACB6ZZH4_THEGA|nr:hypothetical protein BDM02DRAFT_3264890 [Thelephora ganbajun]